MSAQFYRKAIEAATRSEKLWLDKARAHIANNRHSRAELCMVHVEDWRRRRDRLRKIPKKK